MFLEGSFDNTSHIKLPLANFGMLQKAPETAQWKILNKLRSLGMLNCMGGVFRLVINLKLYCK